MAGAILLTCTHCGKEFYRAGFAVRGKKAKNTFCCPEHKIAYNRRHYENFWGSVDKSAGPDGCWIWQGGVDGMGYGSIEYKGKVYLAHRRAYELAKGSIPIGSGYHGTVIRHTCDQPLCVQPNHLLIGTQADNNRDAIERGRLRTKLSEKEVVAIRTDDRSQGAIAKQYGITQSAVHGIKARKTWKHIP